MQEISLKTDRRTQLVDITQQVQDALGSLNGAAAALVYVPHTTAGVTINEGADPAVAHWMSNRGFHFDIENDPIEPERAGRLVVRLATGFADCLSGRFITARQVGAFP